MPSPYWSGPVDCACGAPAEAGLTWAAITEDGTDLHCGVCHLQMWQSVLTVRGRALAPSTVIRRVRAARPDISPADAYLEPWARRTALGLEASPETGLWRAEERRAAAHQVARELCSCCRRHAEGGIR